MMLIFVFNFTIFFVIFCVVFLKIWADALRGYFFGLEKSVFFHISKRQILIISILLINLVISGIVYYFL